MEEYQLKVSAKVAIGFLFIIVGIPMFYSSILSFQIDEIFWGVVLIVLLILWALVVFRAISFKIKIDETHIEKVGLISSRSIRFDEVGKIHFGSTFSNFYLQTDKETISISQDLKDYNTLINQIVNRIKKVSDRKSIELEGDSDKIKKYGFR